MKLKILKLIAWFTVKYRFRSLSREARLALLQYKYQELINPFTKIDTDISIQKKIIKCQNIKLDNQ